MWQSNEQVPRQGDGGGQLGQARVESKLSFQHVEECVQVEKNGITGIKHSANMSMVHTHTGLVALPRLLHARCVGLPGIM